QREPGPPRPRALPGGVKPRTVFQDTDDSLLIVGDDNRLWRMTEQTVEPYPGVDLGELFPVSASTPEDIRPIEVFKSRDGALWIGTKQGVLHVHDRKVDRFSVADGLTGSEVSEFFEDREGNVWASTWQGLDRFHPVSVRTISTRQGLGSSTVWAVQATPDGSVWISTDAGLSRVPAGTTSAVDTGLRGPVYALGLDANGQLLASTPAGLVRQNGVHFTPLAGTPARPVIAIATTPDGNTWMSTVRGELFRRTPDGRLQAVQVRAPEKISKKNQDHVR